MAVSFHSEKTSYKLAQKTNHKKWILQCIALHHKTPGELSIIFTSNEHLLLLNRDYLNHNYFTDVITFDYSEEETVSGDIFISIDQVRENAKIFQAEVEDEIRRVMVHGVLHLIGFNDSTEEEKRVMQKMENEALHLWLNSF